MGGFAGSQWCVVSIQCKVLNSGHTIHDKKTFYFGPKWLNSIYNFLQHEWFRDFMQSLVPQQWVRRDISWKLCVKGEDKFLRDVEPEELFKMTTDMNAVVGYVTKMAWPRLLPSGPEGKPGGKDWAHVAKAVNKGDIANMPKILQDAIAANVP